MSQHPILVTGATGKSGSRVVTQLRAKGIPVRVASRSSEQRFDWTDHTTWDPALEGVKAAYIVPLDGATLTRPFVRRAVQLGVERIVLASGRGVDVPDYAPDSSGLAATLGDGEDAVRNSGVEWTITRPGWFAQNFSEGFFADAIRAGELRLPGGDGSASFVDAEDIAAVVAAALTEDGHAGQIYELSGPRALTLAEAVATISEATGREIRYVPLAVEDYVAELVAQGLPAVDAQGFADVVSPLREGKDSYLSDGLQRALGRHPQDFTDFVKATAAAGGWPS